MNMNFDGPSLHDIGVVDGPEQEGFDRLTRLASFLFESPLSLISIIEFESDRQFFTSSCCLPEPWASTRETPLSHSFCMYVKANDAPLVVEDAREHPLVKDNPAIIDLKIIAYLGVPVYGIEDTPIGALCVIDSKPRTWSASDIDRLKDLGAAVTDQITLRAAVYERDRAASAAQRANRAKTAFLSNISHEIRTPLNGVLGMTSALEETPLSTQQREMVDVIAGAGSHLLGLIGSILDIAKIEAGDINDTREKCDPGSIIGETVALFAAQADEKNLALSQDIRALEGRTVEANAQSIRQVLMNLISNALKFTDTGSVGVRAEILDGDSAGAASLTLMVSDTGPGVPDDQKEDIFCRFNQGDHTTAHHAGGIGLGLSISQMICRAHGGDLVVTDAPGGGAVLTASFAIRPLQSDAATETADIDHAAAQPQEDRLRILIAEDNEMNQMVFKALLGLSMVEADFVTNGAEAFGKLTETAYDGAFIDVNMPVMGGVEFARKHRLREKAGHRLPLIACTANVLADQIAEYSDAGFDRHLSKPLTSSSVADSLNWIRSRRAVAA